MAYDGSSLSHDCLERFKLDSPELLRGQQWRSRRRFEESNVQTIADNFFAEFDLPGHEMS